jgi:signal transduction histidine kinase
VAGQVFRFTVAARLLEELGAKLVGSPSTALAELVKNSYDADAFHVEIILEPPNPKEHFMGRITVRDSGHGMTKKEFEDYWMRIGDDRKARERFSPYLRRPMTGSKGVGRIAVQYLSQKLTVETISSTSPRSKLIASLDWRKALARKDIVEVDVPYSVTATAPGDFPGTTIVLEELKHDWGEDQATALGLDLWSLEPPFRKRGEPTSLSPESIPPLPPKDTRGKPPGSRTSRFRHPEDFQIIFKSPFEEATEKFESTRRQILELWDARIRGKIKHGKADVSIEFKGGRPTSADFSRLRNVNDAIVEDVSFEILVFDPKGRQEGNIPVGKVREYLRDHGGVQIFDQGFRLPYYGTRGNDWLLITDDHARRLSVSELLPEDLQVPEGMYYMPTYWQVFGFVEVNTLEEEGLDIKITRDRLDETPTFTKIRDVVRATIHWYGQLRTTRIQRELSRKPIRPLKAAGALKEVLEKNRDQIPKPVFRLLQDVNQRTIRTVRESEAQSSRQVAALSGFATAGVAAVAYQHEITRQLSELEEIAEGIGAIKPSAKRAEVEELRRRILAWTARARELRRVFSPLLDPENLSRERRFKAAELVTEVRQQLSRSLEGVTIREEVSDDVRLPPATYVEWTSILQNVIFNALNAMQDVSKPQLRFYTEVEGKTRRLVIEDAGVGLDLRRQEDFFKPFVRGIALTPERMERGYGGTGLGLSIVRMVATRRDCKTAFRTPSKDYSTAFVLEWSEA